MWDAPRISATLVATNAYTPENYMEPEKGLFTDQQGGHFSGCMLVFQSVCGGCQNYGPLLGSALYYGTRYLGDPTEDHSFDNHPCKEF